MTRVVSVTSIAVERDSRTFKFAASISRLGYESIVVEGEPSRDLDDELPFELRSPAAGPFERALPVAEGPGPEGESPLAARAKAGLPAPAVSAIRWFLQRVVAPIRNGAFVLRAAVHDIRGRNAQVRELLPAADVYWLHSFFQLPAVYRAARERGAAFLYDTPDAYWEPGQTPVTGIPLKLTMRAYEAIERFGVRRAAAFTTVSEGVAGLMERRFGRRPAVVRNAHDLRLDADPPRGVRELAGVGDDDFLLVMSGNLKPGMAVREGILALRELPPSVHLAFVGRGHDASRELVAEAGLEDRVHLLDAVPPTQIVRFIASADASPILYLPTSPNYVHSLPNGFFHAIAAGLPVLYPPLEEIRAIATEHRLGLEFDPGDPGSIAARVGELRSDPGRLAEFRRNGARARERLNWEAEEKRLAELLEASLSRG